MCVHLKYNSQEININAFLCSKWNLFGINSEHDEGGLLLYYTSPALYSQVSKGNKILGSKFNVKPLSTKVCTQEGLGKHNQYTDLAPQGFVKVQMF